MSRRQSTNHKYPPSSNPDGEAQAFRTSKRSTSKTRLENDEWTSRRSGWKERQRIERNGPLDPCQWPSKGHDSYQDHYAKEGSSIDNVAIDGHRGLQTDATIRSTGQFSTRRQGQLPCRKPLGGSLLTGHKVSSLVRSASPEPNAFDYPNRDDRGARYPNQQRNDAGNRPRSQPPVTRNEDASHSNPRRTSHNPTSQSSHVNLPLSIGQSNRSVQQSEEMRPTDLELHYSNHNSKMRSNGGTRVELINKLDDPKSQFDVGDMSPQCEAPPTTTHAGRFEVPDVNQRFPDRMSHYDRHKGIPEGNLLHDFEFEPLQNSSPPKTASMVAHLKQHPTPMMDKSHYSHREISTNPVENATEGTLIKHRQRPPVATTQPHSNSQRKPSRSHLEEENDELANQVVSYHRAASVKEGFRRRQALSTYEAVGDKLISSEGSYPYTESDLEGHHVRPSGHQSNDARLDKFKRAEGAGACICVCAAAKHSERERVQIKATREKLKSEFSRLRILSKELYDDKVTYEQCIKDSEKKLKASKEMEEFCEEKRRMLKSFEATLKQDRVDYDEKHAHLATREQSLQAAQAELDKRRTRESKEREELEGLKQQLHQSRSELKYDFEAFEKDVASFAEQRSDFNRSRSLLDHEVKNVERKRDELSVLEKDLRHTQGLVDQSQSKNDEARKEIELQTNSLNEMRAQLELEHSSKLEELRFREGILENQESDLANLQLSMDDIRAQLDDQEARLVERENAIQKASKEVDAKTEDLQIQLNSLDEKEATLKDKTASLEEWREQQLSGLRTWETDLHKLERDLNDQKDTNQTEIDRIDRLKVDVERERAALVQERNLFNSEQGAFKTEKESLLDNVDALKLEKQELDRLRSLLADKENKIASRLEDLEARSNRLENEEQQASWIREVKQSVRDQEEQIEYKIHRLRLSEQRLQNDRDDFTLKCVREEERVKLKNIELRSFETDMIKLEKQLITMDKQMNQNRSRRGVSLDPSRYHSTASESTHKYRRSLSPLSHRVEVPHIHYSPLTKGNEMPTESVEDPESSRDHSSINSTHYPLPPYKKDGPLSLIHAPIKPPPHPGNEVDELSSHHASFDDSSIKTGDERLSRSSPPPLRKSTDLNQEAVSDLGDLLNQRNTSREMNVLLLPSSSPVKHNHPDTQYLDSEDSDKDFIDNLYSRNASLLSGPILEDDIEPVPPSEPDTVEEISIYSEESFVDRCDQVSTSTYQSEDDMENDDSEEEVEEHGASVVMPTKPLLGGSNPSTSTSGDRTNESEESSKMMQRRDWFRSLSGNETRNEPMVSIDRKLDEHNFSQNETHDIMNPSTPCQGTTSPCTPSDTDATMSRADAVSRVLLSSPVKVLNYPIDKSILFQTASHTRMDEMTSLLYGDVQQKHHPTNDDTPASGSSEISHNPFRHDEDVISNSNNENMLPPNDSHQLRQSSSLVMKPHPVAQLDHHVTTLPLHEASISVPIEMSRSQMTLSQIGTENGYYHQCDSEDGEGSVGNKSRPASYDRPLTEGLSALNGELARLSSKLCSKQFEDRHHIEDRTNI